MAHLPIIPVHYPVIHDYYPTPDPLWFWSQETNTLLKVPPIHSDETERLDLRRDYVRVSEERAKELECNGARLWIAK
jgi:hypothetical protein